MVDFFCGGGGAGTGLEMGLGRPVVGRQYARMKLGVTLEVVPLAPPPHPYLLGRQIFQR
ncbi:hypothetical protein [Pseudomonas vlassakiae]|uniref:DNA (cytosine-5-)-methyltransferase n=1 Tax=Pseudomonas vlassakiae TaxID=485888 RepID=A0A923K362_9PSED|nr:hypothetical protein [Pseudomonas vlassakiae]MBV4540118.1 hypothetical protein [Pseudomonas vlassakiae]